MKSMNAGNVKPSPSHIYSGHVLDNLRISAVQTWHTPGLTTLIISGLINGLLMFVFCWVFAILIFKDQRDDTTVLKDFLPAGVSMQIFSVMIGCAFYAAFSGCKASIAGPDINPALFFALIVESIQLGSDTDHMPEIESILPTVILAICICSLLIGSIFLALGHFKLTRIVQYLPASLLNGFLACIGYKVMKAALTTTCGDIYYKKPYKFMFWKLFLPALPIGFGLYLIKAYHVRQPAFAICVTLAVPLALFYGFLFASGTSLEVARDQCVNTTLSSSCAGGWFYPEFSNGQFSSVYHTFNLQEVDGGALLYSFKDLPAMVLIVTIDYLLKLAGTKKAIGFDFPFDNEMKTAGMSCLASALFGLSVPVFSQTKFTALNYGITHNVHSRIPGVVTGIFNAIMFFSGFPLINYLPRFFLGGLLIYAGLGFVVDNLIKSWNRVSREEFLAIWTIVIVNALTSLLVAVIVGIILAAIIFALTYGRIGVVKAFFEGRDYESKVVRSVKDSAKLTHLSKRYSIVQMQNYIFFGSAGQILDFTKSFLADQKHLPSVARCRYIIFDWSNVYGIDFSGIGVFQNIVNILHQQRIMIVFTGIQENIIRSMLREGVLHIVAAVFDHLDLGVEWIEEQLLEWSHLVRSRWLEFRPVIKLHDLAKNKAKHDALEEVLKDIGYGHELWKFVKRIVLRKNQVLCEPGTPAEALYIVQRGKFSASFTDRDSNVRKIRSYARGAYINEMAVFTNAIQRYKIIADSEKSAVVAISRQEIARLRTSRPDIFMALQQTILHHYWQTNLKLEREISDLEHFDPISSDARDLSKDLSLKTLSRHRRRSSAGSNAVRRGSQLLSTMLFVGARDSKSEPEDISAQVENENAEKKDSNEKITSQKRLQRSHLFGEEEDVRVQESGLAFLHAIVDLVTKQEDRDLLKEELLRAGTSSSTGQSLDTLFEDSTTGLELLHGRPDIVNLFVYGANFKGQEMVLNRGISEEEDDAHCHDSEQLGPPNLQPEFTCRLSKKQEAECRAVFNSYAADKFVLTTQIAHMLQDTGYYISQKDAALLLHSKIRGAERTDVTTNHENPHFAIANFLHSVGKDDLMRRIDTTKVSRTDQLQIITLFLSNTAVFADLEVSFPGFLEKIAERSELLLFHKGEFVCTEGSPVNSMLVVADGMVNVRKGESKRTMHASQSPIIFGEDLVFLPPNEIGVFSSSVEVLSKQVLVIEVFRHMVQRLLPKEHHKCRQLQDRAIRVKIEQEKRFRLPGRRKLESVIQQQQKAPFGARYRALASIDLFKESVQADQYLISRVAAESELVEFKQDSYIFKQGDVGDFLLVVLSGDVNVRIKMDNGVIHTHRMNFDSSKGGYVLGEIAFFSRRFERSADVIVQSENLIALKLSRASLHSIFESTHIIWFLIRQRAQQLIKEKDAAQQPGNATTTVGGKLKNLGAQTYRLLRVDTQAPSDPTLTQKALSEATLAPDESLIAENTLDSTASRGGAVSPQIDGEWKADMHVSESDFLNIFAHLTFYPLHSSHLSVIRKVFEQYSTAPMHRHSHVYNKSTKSERVDEVYPEGCITLSNLSAMLEDAGLILEDKMLITVMEEWQITDARGYLEPALSFTSFLSIIASAVKKQRLLIEVEATYKLILGTDKTMQEKLQKLLESENHAKPLEEKWKSFALQGIGITAQQIQRAWLEFLDIEVSPEAAQEMVFEADSSELGFISFNDWLASINSVHQIELEGADNFERFEAQMMNMNLNTSFDQSKMNLYQRESSNQSLVSSMLNSGRNSSLAPEVGSTMLSTITKRIASLGNAALATDSIRIASTRRNSGRKVAPEPSRQSDQSPTLAFQSPQINQ